MAKLLVLIVAISPLLACEQDFCAASAAKLGSCQFPDGDGGAGTFSQSRCEAAMEGPACSAADRRILAEVVGCIDGFSACVPSDESGYQLFLFTPPGSARVPDAPTGLCPVQGGVIRPFGFNLSASCDLALQGSF